MKEGVEDELKRSPPDFFESDDGHGEVYGLVSGVSAS